MPRFDFQKEMDDLLKRHPDPRKGKLGKMEFYEKQVREIAYPVFGIVVDNKDPLCQGRIRVQCDSLGPGTVTPWIPIVGMGRRKSVGWWQLPDIGIQAVVAFLNNCRSSPIVLGFVYDLKHRPPKHTTENPAHSVVYQTKKHRIEIIDEEGKESFIISTAKGKIRYTMTKDKGIELINELGSIKIKCRKLTIKGKTIDIHANKRLVIKSEGSLKITSTKGIKIACDKEVRFTGKNIKLDASRGITTEGKQLAAEGDKVFGFDVHNMEMPAPSGTIVVALPHPFMGKLNDKLSKDVKINGHNAAIKGSIAKHDSPVHMQLPGTIKFVNNPKKEGEVTGGTGKKVKINGEEVAVIGSTVSTCNDIGVQDNSTILAVGASMPMPTIINPKNTEEYNLERNEKDKIAPEFTTVRWSKSSVQEGEKVALSAQVKDIKDENMVTLQVWKDGQNPEGADIPYAQLVATVKGGEAQSTWMYTYEGLDIPPDRDPKFFFTAHSAWCPIKKSSNVTMQLQRPELQDAQWAKSTALVGEELGLRVSAKDFEDGKGVSFHIFTEGANTKTDQAIKTLGATIEGGTAEAVWIPKDIRKEGDTTELKYIFTVTASKAQEVTSETVAIKNPKILALAWDKEIIYHGEKVRLLVKTFETKESGRVQLWKKDAQEEDGFLYEQDISLDKEELEIEIEVKFDNEKLLQQGTNTELEICAKIVCEKPITVCKSEILLVKFIPKKL